MKKKIFKLTPLILSLACLVIVLVGNINNNTSYNPPNEMNIKDMLEHSIHKEHNFVLTSSKHIYNNQSGKVTTFQNNQSGITLIKKNNEIVKTDSKSTTLLKDNEVYKYDLGQNDIKQDTIPLDKLFTDDFSITVKNMDYRIILIRFNQNDKGTENISYEFLLDKYNYDLIFYHELFNDNSKEMIIENIYNYQYPLD